MAGSKNRRRNRQNTALTRESVPPVPQGQTAPAPGQQTQEVLFTATRRITGPLPSPEVMREYEELVPGATERFISLMERQQAHREGLENRVTDSNIETTKRGQLFGLIVVIVGMALAAYLTYIGYPIAGVSTGSLDLVLLAAVFVYGNERRIDQIQHRLRQVLGEDQARKGGKGQSNRRR